MKSDEPEGRVLERAQELIINEIRGRERRADAYVAVITFVKVCQGGLATRLLEDILTNF